MNIKRLFCILIVSIAFITTISSCHKDKTTTQNPPPGALVLWSNVHIIDSTLWILQGSPTNGNYIYAFTPNTPNVNVQPGDILVGVTNGGYIRKVAYTYISVGYYKITTTQATMADVFKSGSFTLQVPLNDPNQSNPGVSRSFSNYQLYHANGYSIDLLNAEFSIQPNFTMTFAFDTSGLTNFQMATTNTASKDSFTIAVKGLEPSSWKKDTTFASVTTNTVQWVTAYGNIPVPVVIQLNLSFLANAIGGSANYGVDTSNTQVNWAANMAFTGGAQYTSNMWQPMHNSVATNTVGLDSAAKNGNMNTRIAFLSQITSKFYNVAGPQVTIGLSGKISGTSHYGPNYTRRTDEWTVATDAQTIKPIFGRNMGTFSQTYTSDSVFFQIPYQVVKISGDAQVGNIALPLPQPLVVKVKDSNGNPISNITVTFKVTGGGGTLAGSSATSIVAITDQNGLAQTTWTMGPLQGSNRQTLSATVLDGLRQPINGAPVLFTATAQ